MTTDEGKMVGYGAIVGDKRYKNNEGDLLAKKMRIGPGGHHESNHGPECMRKHGCLSSCRNIAGVKWARHESDQGTKKAHLRSINIMTFSDFTYSLNVLDELQNRTYNTQHVGRLLGGIDGHDPIPPACHATLWACGRCFCPSH